MTVNTTPIKGLYLIEFKLFEDLRGQLLKTFSCEAFSSGIQKCMDPDKRFEFNLDFKETWFTKSKKDVIRAMHLQIAPRACEKLVAIIQGAVQDVILDLREDSETYGQYYSVLLSDQNPKALYIPKGCAHGYRVVEDQSIVMYMATDVHVGEYDLGIKWDSFGYPWGIEEPILSQKDQTLPPFEGGKAKLAGVQS